jgi:hypothetical protein
MRVLSEAGDYKEDTEDGEELIYEFRLEGEAEVDKEDIYLKSGKRE